MQWFCSCHACASWVRVHADLRNMISVPQRYLSILSWFIMSGAYIGLGQSDKHHRRGPSCLPNFQMLMWSGWLQWNQGPWWFMACLAVMCNHSPVPEVGAIRGYDTEIYCPLRPPVFFDSCIDCLLHVEYRAGWDSGIFRKTKSYSNAAHSDYGIP